VLSEDGYLECGACRDEPACEKRATDRGYDVARADANAGGSYRAIAESYRRLRDELPARQMVAEADQRAGMLSVPSESQRRDRTELIRIARRTPNGGWRDNKEAFAEARKLGSGTLRVLGMTRHHFVFEMQRDVYPERSLADVVAELAELASSAPTSKRAAPRRGRGRGDAR